MCNFNSSQVAKDVVNELFAEMATEPQKYNPDFIPLCHKFGKENVDRLAYALACRIWLRLNP